MKNSFNNALSLLSIFFFCLTCGIPSNTQIIYEPEVEQKIVPNQFNSAVLTNHPYQFNIYYNNSGIDYVKGYNFFYRIYSSKEIKEMDSSSQVGGGADYEPFVNWSEILFSKILSQAVSAIGRQSESNQVYIGSVTNEFNKKYPYFKMAYYNDIGKLVLKGEHYSSTNFGETLVKYIIESPDSVNGYRFKVYEKGRESETAKFFFRKVYDLDEQTVIAKDFNPTSNFNYSSIDKILLDEDISNKPLTEEPSSQDRYYYIAWFVCMYGFDFGSKLDYLVSNPSLLGVSEFKVNLLKK